MKWIVQKGWGTWHIRDEVGILRAQIKYKKKAGVAKEVFDAKGVLIFTTDVVYKKEQENHNAGTIKQYVIYRQQEIVARTAVDIQNKGQRISFQPDRIEQMMIESTYGNFKVERRKDNSVLIKYQEECIGQIKGFFSMRSKVIDVKQIEDPIFWASIYAVVEYMMHEDDLIII